MSGALRCMVFDCMSDIPFSFSPCKRLYLITKRTQPGDNRSYPHLNGHCSLDIKKTNKLFNGGHIQLHFEIYLNEICQCLLKSCSIFSRKPVQESRGLQTCQQPWPNFPNISAFKQWIKHVLTLVILLGWWNPSEWCSCTTKNGIFQPPKHLTHHLTHFV